MQLATALWSLFNALSGAFCLILKFEGDVPLYWNWTWNHTYRVIFHVWPLGPLPLACKYLRRIACRTGALNLHTGAHIAICPRRRLSPRRNAASRRWRRACLSYLCVISRYRQNHFRNDCVSQVCASHAVCLQVFATQALRWRPLLLLPPLHGLRSMQEPPIALDWSRVSRLLRMSRLRRTLHKSSEHAILQSFVSAFIWK